MREPQWLSENPPRQHANRIANLRAPTLIIVGAVVMRRGSKHAASGTSPDCPRIALKSRRWRHGKPSPPNKQWIDLRSRSD